jgi:hypothetical protein
LLTKLFTLIGIFFVCFFFEGKVFFPKSVTVFLCAICMLKYFKILFVKKNYAFLARSKKTILFTWWLFIVLFWNLSQNCQTLRYSTILGPIVRMYINFWRQKFQNNCGGIFFFIIDYLYQKITLFWKKKNF